MTRYIGEPSPEKKLAEGRALTESLARRPSPISAGGTPGYAVFRSSGYVTSAAGATRVPLIEIIAPHGTAPFYVNAGSNVELTASGLYLYHIQATPAGYAAGDLFDVSVDRLNAIPSNWFPWVLSGTTRDFRETRIADGNPRFTGGVGINTTPSSPLEVEIVAQAFNSGFTPIALTTTITVAWTYFGAF